MADLQAPSINPSAPVNGSNVGFANQGNWTYTPSTAQKPATGNPQTTGGNTTTPATNQSNGFQPSQNTSNLYNAFMGANGGVSSSQQSQIQNSANQFANNIYNKALGNYNSSVNHAQSNEQLANQQAQNTYQQAQTGLQTDSFLGYLKGQDQLGSRGVGMTGGATDDLNARTSLEYQRQLSGLLNNYQLAQQQAQKAFGDSQYSAQQALNNVDPTQQAQQLYMQLMSQAQDAQSRQASNYASAYGTSLTNDRNAYDSQIQNQYNMANLKEKTANDAATLAEKYYSTDRPYNAMTQADQAKYNLQGLEDASKWSGVNPLTGQRTDQSSLDWAKQNWNQQYQGGMLGVAQQNASTNAFSAQTGRINATINQQNANSRAQEVLQGGQHMLEQDKIAQQSLAQKVGNEQAQNFTSQANSYNAVIQQFATNIRTASQNGNPPSQQDIDGLQQALNAKQALMDSAAKITDNFGKGSGSNFP